MSWIEELNKNREEMLEKAQELSKKNYCEIEDIENLTEQQKAWLITELIALGKKNETN